ETRAASRRGGRWGAAALVRGHLPPVTAWAEAAPSSSDEAAHRHASIARPGLRRSRAPGDRSFRPRRFLPLSIVSFRALPGLADGLALKELRYAADACDSPQLCGSPALRGMWTEIQPEVGGT